MDDYRTAPVEPEMKQLLSFAEKVARDASQTTPDDIAALRSAGFSDRALLDAAHVAGFFRYMNRVVLALGAAVKIVDSGYCERTRYFFAERNLRLSED